MLEYHFNHDCFLIDDMYFLTIFFNVAIAWKVFQHRFTNSKLTWQNMKTSPTHLLRREIFNFYLLPIICGRFGKTVPVRLTLLNKVIGLSSWKKLLREILVIWLISRFNSIYGRDQQNIGTDRQTQLLRE